MNAVPQDEPLLSAEEAARLLGVSDTCIRRAAQNGELQTIIEGRHLFLHSDVATLGERRSEGHGPECGMSTDPFGNSHQCDCILCHCGPRHEPGGFLGTCQRCGRKRREDLRT